LSSYSKQKKRHLNNQQHKMEEDKEGNSEENIFPGNVVVNCHKQKYCNWGCVCGLPLRIECNGQLDCPDYSEDPAHYDTRTHYCLFYKLCPEISTMFKCGLGHNKHYLKHKSLLVHFNPRFKSIMRDAVFVRYFPRVMQFLYTSQADCIPPPILSIIVSYTFY
jgi:hypothetical protein